VPPPAPSLAAPLAALSTERLVLRPPLRQDLEPFVGLCADAEVMRHIGAGRPLDRPTAEITFDVLLARWESHGFGLRSALDRATGTYLGFVGIAVVPPEGVRPGEVEIGWRLRRPAWGRGLASEGARAVRDHDAWGALGLGSLVAFAQPANAASRRVMEKLGMRLEGPGRGPQGREVVVYRLDRSHRQRIVSRA
jgi:RimJ/RimL family protein N-acetyltransferase